MNKIGSLDTDELLYQNRKLINLEVKKADERLAETPFQYEVPNTLCHGYHINQKGYVEVYEYYIKYEGKVYPEMGFITSLPLNPLDDIKLYFGVDQSEKVSIIQKKHGLMIQKLHFEQIFIFNSYLCAEWFKVAEKNVKTQTRDIQELLQYKFLNFRTYLFVLIEEGNIALNKMINLVKQKLGQTQGESLLDKYMSLEDQSFKHYYSTNLFYSPIHQTVYCVYNVFDNIWSRSIDVFFQYLLLNSNQDDLRLETILEYYELTKDELTQNSKSSKLFSIGQLVYDRQFKKSISSFDNLREKFLEYKNTPEQFEYGCPLAVVEYSQNLRTLYFSSIPITAGLGIKEFSVRKRNFTLKKPIVSLIPIKNLKKHLFTVAEIDKTMQLPFIMLNIERQIVAQEFKSLINLNEIKLNSLCQANQTPGYSQQENFEVFESLGDSILKVVTTYVLYKNFSQSKEEQYLTDKRIEFISNNHLGIIASLTEMNYYVRQLHFRTENWVCSVLPNVELNKEFKKIIQHIKLNVHQMADIYEAILGATFESTYKLEGVMRFLFETQHPIWRQSLETSFVEESLQISLEDIDENLINENSNYTDLVGDSLTFGEISIQQIQKNKIDFIHSVQNGVKKNHSYIKFLEYFQEKTLGYKFQNLVLLVEAFTYKQFSHEHGFGQNNYQNLEFLGDAVLEGLIIANIFHEFQRKGMNVYILPQSLQVNPLQIHKVKVSLLSNQFMSRIAVLKGFHIFILNQDQVFQKEMEEFIDKIDFNEKFMKSINSTLIVPKALSDVWESVCGAILIDGGWSAIIKTYGHFYKKFLIFISKYIFQIEENHSDKLQNLIAQQKKQFKLQVKPVGDKFHVQVLVEGVVISEAQDPIEKQARNMAIMKATQILKL